MCVCVCVCVWAWMCGCVWQIYDAGPELWCSQHPFIICHLTTHEIHGITSPLPFRVKFSPFLPSFFPPRLLVSLRVVLGRLTSLRMCTHTHTRVHKDPYTRALPTPFSHLRCPSFVWAWKGQELRGSREEEEEVCGGMRGHGLNVSILALNMYVILQLFFIKCVSKTPGLRKTMKCHLVINTQRYTWNWWCFLTLHCPVGHYFLWWINISLWVMSSGGLEHSQRLLHLPLVSYAGKLWTRKYCAQDCGVSRYTHSHTTSHTLTHAHTGYVNLYRPRVFQSNSSILRRV